MKFGIYLSGKLSSITSLSKYKTGRPCIFIKFPCFQREFNSLDTLALSILRSKAILMASTPELSYLLDEIIDFVFLKDNQLFFLL